MFDEAQITSGPALTQSPEFARALQALGQSPLWLPGGPDMLVLRRRVAGLRVAMIPRYEADQTAALPDRLHAAATGATPVLLSPDRPTSALARIGALPVMTPATVARLDLTPNHDTLRARMHQKWRNRLRHGERQPWRITRERLPPDPGHWLLTAEAAQARALGYRNWPTALTLAYAHANPTATKLFTAWRGKDAVAGMVFLTHGHSATYHIGLSTPEGKSGSAHNLLLWHAMMWLQRQGISSLDLGLLDTQHAAGLARFKLGCGATPWRMGGTWLWWRPARWMFRTLARLDRKRMVWAR